MRTIIDLPDEQIAKLAEICAEERISRAEAIRRAVGEWLARGQGDREERILEKTFGAWKHLGVDSDAYLAEIRSEWDREQSG